MSNPTPKLKGRKGVPDKMERVNHNLKTTVSVIDAAFNTVLEVANTRGGVVIFSSKLRKKFYIVPIEKTLKQG